MIIYVCYHDQGYDGYSTPTSVARRLTDAKKHFTDGHGRVDGEAVIAKWSLRGHKGKLLATMRPDRKGGWRVESFAPKRKVKP